MEVSLSGSIFSVEFHNSGVPQGSVLSPLLFIIFVNDLPECIKSSLQIADDTKMWAVIRKKEDAEKLQLHLENNGVVRQ